MEFVIGLVVGVLIGFAVKTIHIYRQSGTGTITVLRPENMIRYSLEIAQDPETIATKKRVIFKVKEAEEEKLDRGSNSDYNED